MLIAAARMAVLRSSAPTTTATAFRVVAPAIATRSFAIDSSLKSKEKVEEERFIKEREKAFYNKKKAEMAQKMEEAESKHFQEVIAPAMAEAESVLNASGDSVSDKGLEALAKWKLGL